MPREIVDTAVMELFRDLGEIMLLLPNHSFGLIDFEVPIILHKRLTCSIFEKL